MVLMNTKYEQKWRLRPFQKVFELDLCLGLQSNFGYVL